MIAAADSHPLLEMGTIAASIYIYIYILGKIVRARVARVRVSSL